jgi:MFS family permease
MKGTSERNYRAFLWHAAFLAFAQNFIDIDTIIPAMLVEAGGTPVHIGIMAAILTGGSSLTQLIFAPLISNDPYKRKYLLIGINSRMAALLVIAIMLWTFSRGGQTEILPLLFIAITVFAVGGAFANVSYTDILGKTVSQDVRKRFFSSKQLINSIVILGSAYLATRVLTWKSYPLNYSYMFMVGFTALMIASLGFWRLREDVPSRLPIRGIRHYFAVMKDELRINRRIRFFLGFINTQGIAISFLPFIILYAKEEFNTGSTDTGNFLLFKVAGGVLISIVILLFSRVSRYRILLYLNVILSVMLPVALLVIPGRPPFWLLFFIGGLVFAIYSITMNGVLLEISGNDNRAIYTGLAGAGNILPALFPLLGGFFIKAFGFDTFFIIYGSVLLLALYFIYKLKCLK